MEEPTANISSVEGFGLQVVNWLGAPIWCQIKYLCNYNTNLDNLQEEVEKLKNTRDELQRKVHAAERNVEEIKQNVRKWLKDVDAIIGKSEQLIPEKAFNLKENDSIQLLVEKFSEVSYPTNPPETWLRSNEDYLAFESRNSTVKNVLDALKDENIFMIGVHGMVGLWKTTLVQEVGRQAEKDKLFDEIVFVETVFDWRELKLSSKLRSIGWQSRSKTLQISYDKSANILLGLIQKLENLEALQLYHCRFKEILSCEKDEKLMQITRGPSSASFQNLKVLSVYYCNGLIKLITPLTARSLMQLREMSIESCGVLIEIIENEGGDTTTSTEIVFYNLKLLFRRLGSLTCFCSRNYSFKFSSLEKLTIGECHNMKTFSQGILSTPKLYKVNYERWDVWKWENIMEVENEGNDLNKTIQGAYRKQLFSDYRQSLQFQNLNKEKRNIQIEVMRGGKAVKISIFDVVVGDILPLRIGDQVPDGGVLVTGHSLAIDESSMTGESKTVRKDQKSPFLMSGCKVADGVGT